MCDNCKHNPQFSLQHEDLGASRVMRSRRSLNLNPAKLLWTKWELVEQPHDYEGKNLWKRVSIGDEYPVTDMQLRDEKPSDEE